MIWVDWCIVAVFLISIVIGLLRGFAREILNVLSWVLAFGLAWLFGDMVADLLTGHIASPQIRSVCAYAVLFVSGLLIGAILTYLLTEWIRGSFLDGIDRTLGGAIGFVRALFFTCVFLAIAGTMGAKQDRWWNDSLFIPRIDWLAEDLKLLVPDRWLERLKPVPENVPVPTVQKKH